MSMDPEPAEGWPDRPLTEAEARDLLADARAVWVMDHDAATRAALGAGEDGVVDVVLETDDGFEMYSYTDHGGDRQWLDYGTADAATIHGTLASYRLLAGDTDLEDLV